MDSRGQIEGKGERGGVVSSDSRHNFKLSRDVCEGGRGGSERDRNP